MDSSPTAQALETALILPVPAAEKLVDPWRRQYDPSASLGVRAHITLLYPFVPPDRINETIIDGLRTFFASAVAFRFTLSRLAAFPGALYLDLDPPEPVTAIIEQLTARYPETPPYGGRFERVVPHLTVAQVPDAHHLEEIRTELATMAQNTLPIEAQANESWLMQGPTDGLWATEHRFPFGRRG